MKISTFLSICSISAALVSARPLRKRELVYHTYTQPVYETIYHTRTVWVEPTPPAYTPSAQEYTPTPTPTPYTPPVQPTSYKPAPQPQPTYNPKPVPSSTPAYTPSPVYTPKPIASSSAPAPAETSSSPAPGYSPSSGSKYTGDMTWYVDTGARGSCGWYMTPDENIVAVAADMMASTAGGPNCGKTITISYNGHTEIAKVSDTCEGCSGASIDLSEGLFEKFAATSVGRISGVVWWFN